MYKYHKKNNKIIIKYFILVLILIILLSISLLIPRNKNTLLKDGVTIVEKIFMYPFITLNTEKNETQTESYTIQKNINSSLEKEISELKKALDLNKTLTEYDPVHANVI